MHFQQLITLSKSPSLMQLPYSGNLLQEEIFANLAILLSEEFFLNY